MRKEITTRNRGDFLFFIWNSQEFFYIMTI